jgi:hypothetical protein
MAPRKKGNAAHARKVVPGGHIDAFWPDDIIVATDPKHPLYDHADASRTDPNNPSMQRLVAFIREKGVPGRPIVWQDKRDDGGIDTYMVDGRRRRAARRLVNQELAANGLTGERLEVTVRNDLGPVQLRELVAEVNEGAEPPSLAQRMGQACALVEEYYRVAKLNHPDPPDHGELVARAATKFRGTSADTIHRWTQIGHLVEEAQAFIYQERVPVEAIDALSMLGHESQRKAIEIASGAKSPKAAKKAIQAFASSFGSGDEDSTSKRRTRTLNQWQQLDRAVEARSTGTPDAPLVAGAREVLRFRRCEIELPELLERLGVQLVKEPPAKAPTSEPKLVSTRRWQDRAAFDAAVLEVLKKGGRPMLAQEVGAEAGGTPEQLRVSLHRLVDANCVIWSGKAVATRYTALKGAVLPPPTPPERPKRAASDAPPSPPNLKSHEGRHAYVLAIFEAIESERACTDSELRRLVGGSRSQVRKMLAVLVSEESVEQREDGSYGVIGDPPASRKVNPLDVRIALRFEQAAEDDRMTCADLAAELKEDVKDVYASIRRLVHDGLVVRHGHGRGSRYAAAASNGDEDTDDAESQLGAHDATDDAGDVGDYDCADDADEDSEDEALDEHLP